MTPTLLFLYSALQGGFFLCGSTFITRLNLDKALFVVYFFTPRRSEAKKTKARRKTNNPQFDEVFYFEVIVFVCSQAMS